LESSEEKNHSLKDICTFKSLDKFLDHVIDNKIDAFLRGSLADWAKFFQLKKIDMSKFAPSWEGFTECFQRRHVIVHNGSRVNRQYLDRVDPEWIELHKEETQLGKVLPVSSEYLSESFDYFELVGVLLCQECWKRFARDERNQREALLGDHQYDCLVDARWHVAESIGSWAIAEGELTGSGTLVSRINRWLSIKRQGRWAEIEDEVKGFDLSVLGPRYLAAIHALAGQFDLFFSVVRKAELSQHDLTDWPILEEVRKDTRFKELLEENHSGIACQQS
jgi:hypothetical protein